MENESVVCDESRMIMGLLFTTQSYAVVYMSCIPIPKAAPIVAGSVFTSYAAQPIGRGREGGIRYLRRVEVVCGWKGKPCRWG